MSAVSLCADASTAAAETVSAWLGVPVPMRWHLRLARLLGALGTPVPDCGKIIESADPASVGDLVGAAAIRARAGASGPQRSAAEDPLRGGLTRLREPSDDDWRILFRYAADPWKAFRWTQPIAGLGLERFREQFSSAHIDHYAVDGVAMGADTRLCGHVGLYGLNLHDGYAFIGTIGFDTVTALDRLDAILTFLTLAFERFPLRKAYFESIQPDVERLVDLPTATLELVFPENDYACGRYWDRHIFSIDAAEWRSWHAQQALVVGRLLELGRELSR